MSSSASGVAAWAILCFQIRSRRCALVVLISATRPDRLADLVLVGVADSEAELRPVAFRPAVALKPVGQVVAEGARVVRVGERLEGGLVTAAAQDLKLQGALRHQGLPGRQRRKAPSAGRGSGERWTERRRATERRNRSAARC